MKSIFIFMVTCLSILPLASANETEPSIIMITVTVPDSAWQLEVLEVHQTDKEIIVISEVSRDPNVFGAQVITTLSQKLNLIIPDLPVKHYVLGKTWGWENQDKGVQFIKERKELDEMLKGAKKLPLKE